MHVHKLWLEDNYLIVRTENSLFRLSQEELQHQRDAARLQTHPTVAATTRCVCLRACGGALSVADGMSHDVELTKNDCTPLTALMRYTSLPPPLLCYAAFRHTQRHRRPRPYNPTLSGNPHNRMGHEPTSSSSLVLGATLCLCCDELTASPINN
ncbi:hypothetical protein B0H19DRAFT_1271198 [Mycena capillaripes]|nr:hypothetical protein B0H19DRAFT_1271198 [Mycena capillaripes]